MLRISRRICKSGVLERGVDCRYKFWESAVYMGHFRSKNREGTRISPGTFHFKERREITSKNWGNDQWKSKPRLWSPENQMKKIFQGRNGQMRGMQLRDLVKEVGWQLDLAKHSFDNVVLVDWWRRKPDSHGLEWKEGKVETKYRQFFQVLPQRKTNMWNSGLAQKVGFKVLFHVMN